LKQCIFEKSDIPVENQTLMGHGKIYKNDWILQDLPTLTNIEMILGLQGGKGGFGSLLRGQAATKRKITNFDSSRDLQGRRIKNVNNAKKLAEWLKKKKEEDEKIRTELEDFKKMQKTMLASKADYKLSQDFKENLEKWNNEMSQSIKDALRKKLRANRQKPVTANEDDEFKAPLKKMIKKEIDSSLNKEELIRNKLTELMKELKTASNEEAAKNPEEAPKAEKIEEEPSKETVKVIEEKPIKKIEFSDIDLSTYGTLEELIALGGDYLKDQLMKLGLKCGGAVKDRAQRLYDIKKNPLLLMDPKYIAKKN
jgi:hypothetical protein